MGDHRSRRLRNSPRRCRAYYVPACLDDPSVSGRCVLLKIKNGTLVTSGGSTLGDVVCRDGRTEQVGGPFTLAVDEEVDARGLLVFPGFIDPHVHSRDPG